MKIFKYIIEFEVQEPKDLLNNPHLVISSENPPEKLVEVYIGEIKKSSALLEPYGFKMIVREFKNESRT